MTVIQAPHAPAAIGPYSQAIHVSELHLVFTSGQLPLDPRTMTFAGDDIRSQTRQSLQNLQAVLEQAGATLQSVVKTTCFLADMEDFAAFNEVYSEFFSGTTGAPARSCVQVGRLPKDALVEVEAIAIAA